MPSTCVVPSALSPAITSAAAPRKSVAVIFARQHRYTADNRNPAVNRYVRTHPVQLRYMLKPVFKHVFGNNTCSDATERTAIIGDCASVGNPMEVS